MAIRTLVGCLAIGTMLSGCLTPSEMRERDAAKDMATCKSFGFKLGQPQYNQCIVTEQRYRKTQLAIIMLEMEEDSARIQRQQAASDSF